MYATIISRWVQPSSDDKDEPQDLLGMKVVCLILWRHLQGFHLVDH